MITRITVENFKSYRRAELPLGPLTLLIGTNASGKTNVIEAIRFLSLLADGQGLDYVFVDLYREQAVIRGDARALARDGSETFSVGCRLDDEAVGKWSTLSLSLRPADDGMTLVSESICTDSGSEALYVVERSTLEGMMQLTTWDEDGVPEKRRTSLLLDDSPVFTTLDSPGIYGALVARASYLVPRRFRDRLREILFVDPVPASMRGYSFAADHVLAEDAHNLSSTLYHLREQGLSEDVLSFVRDLPEHVYNGLDFHLTDRRDVMVRLEESFGSRSTLRDAPVLSDGTLRVLAIAAAVLSVPEGSLVVLEEVDNGIHPSRAGRLLRNIRRVATERGLSILLTSHNPALLDTLPDAAVPDVVACYRDPDEGDSRLVRLAELVEYPELIARGPLGQLMTKGILERTLQHRQTEEERRAEASRRASNLIDQLRRAE